MSDTLVKALLDVLIPPSGDLPGGSVALPALLAADAQDSGQVLHVLAAAYFADPRVRAHYDLDRNVRPDLQRDRLATLLAAVPHAPRLPERS